MERFRVKNISTVKELKDAFHRKFGIEIEVLTLKGGAAGENRRLTALRSAEKKDVQSFVIPDDTTNLEQIVQDTLGLTIKAKKNVASKAKRTKKTSNKLFCPQCGTGLEIGDKFCFSCGNKVELGKKKSEPKIAEDSEAKRPVIAKSNREVTEIADEIVKDLKRDKKDKKEEAVGRISELIRSSIEKNEYDELHHGLNEISKDVYGKGWCEAPGYVNDDFLSDSEVGNKELLILKKFTTELLQKHRWQRITKTTNTAELVSKLDHDITPDDFPDFYQNILNGMHVLGISRRGFEQFNPYLKFEVKRTTGSAYLIADKHYHDTPKLHIYQKKENERTAYVYSSNDSASWEEDYGIALLSFKSDYLGVNTELSDRRIKDRVSKAIREKVWDEGFCVRQLWSEVEKKKPWSPEGLPASRRDYSLNMLVEEADYSQLIYERSNIDLETLDKIISDGVQIRSIGIRKFTEFDDMYDPENSPINWSESYKQFFLLADKRSNHQFYLKFGHETGCLSFDEFIKTCESAVLVGYHLSYIFYDPFNNVYYAFYDTELSVSGIVNLFATNKKTLNWEIMRVVRDYIISQYNVWGDLESITLNNALILSRELKWGSFQISQNIYDSLTILMKSRLNVKDAVVFKAKLKEVGKELKDYKEDYSHKINFVSNGKYCSHCGEMSDSRLQQMSCYKYQGHNFVWNGGAPRCNKCGKSNLDLDPSTKCI